MTRAFWLTLRVLRFLVSVPGWLRLATIAARAPEGRVHVGTALYLAWMLSESAGDVARRIRRDRQAARPERRR